MAAVYLHYSVVQSPQGNKSEKTFLLLLLFLIVCRGGLDPQCEKRRERVSEGERQEDGRTITIIIIK